MEWIRENWVFLAIVVFFIAMQFFGFGCCGGHGRKHGRGKHDDDEEHSSNEIIEKEKSKKGHGCC